MSLFGTRALALMARAHEAGELPTLNKIIRPIITTPPSTLRFQSNPLTT